jgi:hypothetical protein
MTSLWRPANNGTGRRIWFLYRDHPEVHERCHWSRNGRLIRYASAASAQRAANRLNAGQVAILTSCPPLLDRSYVGRYLRDLPDCGFVLEVDGREVDFGPEYRYQLERQLAD